VESFKTKTAGRWLDNGAPDVTSQRFNGIEPFVDADVVASFLFVKRKTVLDWARAGVIPTHEFGGGKRIVWRFRISEISSHQKQRCGTMEAGSPEIARMEQYHG